MNTPSGFSSLLIAWRKRRGLSQLQLAMAASCSQRHISFLEIARSKPSREMVLRLAATLDLPLRHSNEMLLAAGFAPQWSEAGFDADALSPIREALEHMLAQQEPFPVVVVDRRWNLLRANQGAVRLVEFLLGPLLPGTVINLADALVAPDVLRPHLSNWVEVVRYFLRSVEADATADGTAETASLLQRLLNYPDIRSVILSAPSPATDGPVLPMQFEKGEIRLRLFTTIATLGTPRDITLQDLRIESFFPMDEETRSVFHGWAVSSGRT